MAVRLFDTQDTGRITNSQNPVTLDLENNGMLPWTQVTVSVFNGSGAPVSGVSGIIEASVRQFRSSLYEPFLESLNLETSNTYSFLPQLASVDSFRFMVSGLPVDHTCMITVLSWE